MDGRVLRQSITILIVGSLLAGCSASSKTKGAAIGASAGAIIGGMIGENNDNTAAGVILGAAIGGAAGAYIGSRMDKQAEEMQRDLAGAEIERIGEGIKVTFDSGILFAVSSSELQFEAKKNIEKLAVILNKYPDTNILIEGHTDATGSYDFNMSLSEKRAESVANYTIAQEVDILRIDVVGHGPDYPVASNETEDARRLNRRVEIAIFASEKLKKTALEMQE